MSIVVHFFLFKSYICFLGRAQASRQSPSPPHTGAYAQVRDSRPYGHQRKDSDTLRSAGLMPSGSPTAVDGLAPRISPSSGGYSSQSSVSVLSNRHRRSPTAPEPATNNDIMPAESAPSSDVGKTWAAGEGREREDGYGEMPARRTVPAPVPSPPAQSHMQPPSKHSVLQQQSQAPDVRSRNMVVCITIHASIDKYLTLRCFSPICR